MVRKSKWIAGIFPTQPVSEAARAALGARLALLRHYLPLAARRAFEDVEYVHQLRVSARRAEAVLEAFAEVLPPRRAAWMARQLKRVRKAAGAARDDDVLLPRLGESDRPDMDPLLHALLHHRVEVQRPIRQLYRKLRRKGLGRRIHKLIEKTRWRGAGDEPCLAALAREQLGVLVPDWLALWPSGSDDIEAVHRFRIAGKRLRYALEIFAPALGPSFREQLYPVIEALQDELGRINDHARALERFEQWLAETSDAGAATVLQELAAAERQALEQSRQQFSERWPAERAAELETAFAEILSAPALQGGC